MNLFSTTTLGPSGGDWERKNKLKVYEGIFKVSQADFEGAANLFLQGVATFAATEIFSFREFVPILFKYHVFIDFDSE